MVRLFWHDSDFTSFGDSSALGVRLQNLVTSLQPKLSVLFGSVTCQSDSFYLASIEIKGLVMRHIMSWIRMYTASIIR